MEKYTYEQVLFVVEEAKKTYEQICEMDLRSKFPTIFKKSIFRGFCDKFGEAHTYNSVKMFIDNILANWGIKGYTNFSKGSKIVQDAASKV